MLAVELKIAQLEDINSLETLKEMINEVYWESEQNIWQDVHRRISVQGLKEIIAHQQLIIAKYNGAIAGCIHLEPITDTLYKFKMVSVSPNYKQKGIGGQLVSFAEQTALTYGAQTMQLELLVPIEFEHPDKVILDKWYTKIGYVKQSVHDVDYCHQGLGQFLKTPCNAVVYQKQLIL